MYSLQRKRERYIIRSTWKIIDGFVPNIEDVNCIKTKIHRRLGLQCVDPQINGGELGGLANFVFHSLAVNGPRLFNVLPRDIRDM